MQNWESLIDPSWFGLIAGYLRSPRSPIDYLIHVKDPERLPEVAERIDQDLARGAFPARQLSPALEALLQEGAIKVSSRHPLENLDPGAAVNPDQVRSAAPCQSGTAASSSSRTIRRPACAGWSTGSASSALMGGPTCSSGTRRSATTRDAQTCSRT